MNELMTWLQQFPRTTRCSAILGRAAVDLSPDTFTLFQGLCVPAECVESVLRNVRKLVLGYPARASLAEVLVTYELTPEQWQAFQERGPYALLDNVTMKYGPDDGDQ